VDHNYPTHALSTAADVMTEAVIFVRPSSSVQDVAKVLLDARISAVPVVDDAGALLGIVSEGDLLGRSTEDRLAGQEWWLAIMSGPGQMEAAETAAASALQVRDVMQAPVVTVGADTPLREVAEVLRAKAIKRVPVLRDGRMIGIVSRADLLRAIETQPVGAQGGGTGTLAAMIGSFFGSASTTRSAHAAEPPPMPQPAPMTASGFRGLVDASVQGGIDEKKAFAHEADLKRIEQVKTMLHEHLGTEMWETLMTHARVVAAHGGKEIELLRFPSDLCSDGGRKINNVDPAWAETLRGEAAEVHARWARDLKPAGFGLAARVVDYPHGMPGDIALFLLWEV
jgi:CBS domain-containing protein